LSTVLNGSKDYLKQTEEFQQRLHKQLEEFERSLGDINRIIKEKVEQGDVKKLQKNDPDKTEHKRPHSNSAETQALLLSLNAEAIECRLQAVQLQEQAKLIEEKAQEIEQNTDETDQLAQLSEQLFKQKQEAERERAKQEELERRVRVQEERNRKLELPQRQERQQIVETKQNTPEQDWPLQEFINDDRYPPCIVRISPNAGSIDFQIHYLPIAETENLLDVQEELISTPLKIVVQNEAPESSVSLALPYIFKRSTHRENVIKARDTNGIWISMDTQEIFFESHKDKRFVECKLYKTMALAVVSRLKRDKIIINKDKRGKYTSSADQRFTIEWEQNIVQNDFRIDACIQPVDLPTFSEFRQRNPHDCDGLIAVGPIVELMFDDVELLKKIGVTLPMLIQMKKTPKHQAPKPTQDQQLPPSSNDPVQMSSQDTLLQQQQQIFKSVLGDDSETERLVLLYSGLNENTWHVDNGVRLIDSKTKDLITTHLSTLYGRLIVARVEKHLTNKQLKSTISLLYKSLTQRSVTVLLRTKITAPNEVCLVCFPSSRIDTLDKELSQENYTNNDEQMKELVLQEGQLLELRFRGNVLPSSAQKQKQLKIPFAFNTNFPFYWEEVTKQEWHETDVLLAELVVRLPKVQNETLSRPTTPKSPVTFTNEGILNESVFRDLSNNLIGDEWKLVAKKLGLTRIRIESIQHDYRDESGYHMLLAWFKRVPKSADKVHDLFIVPFSKICQRDEIVKIWKIIAQELMLTNDDINQIEHNCPSQHERCLRTLELWAKQDNKADLYDLGRVMRLLGHKPLA
ncbi:unnamed protein product, partial [Didymodactylos carnosus]